MSQLYFVLHVLLVKIYNQQRILWFWMAFIATSLVDTLLVVSHPVNALSAGRHFVNYSPSVPQMSWSDSTAHQPELPEARVPPVDCYVIQKTHKDFCITWWQCNRCSGRSCKDITHITHCCCFIERMILRLHLKVSEPSMFRRFCTKCVLSYT